MTDTIRILLLALLVLAGPAHSQGQPAPAALESLTSLSPPSARLQVPIESWQTPQGSRVLFVHRPELPMFDLQVLFDAGSARDDGASGLAQLTLGMLKEGTQHRDAMQIAEGFDEIGARFHTSTSRTKATIRLRSLSTEQHRSQAVTLLAEVLGQPLFANEKLQEVKDQLINASTQRQSLAYVKAVDRLFEHAYANHPFAANDTGTAQSINTLQIADITAFHQQALSAGNALITLVGDLSPDQARETALQISAALPAGPPLPPLQPPAGFEAEIYHLDHPGTQSFLLFALPGIDIQHTDAPALTLANLMLGGPGATSRLFEVLRTERGLTYSAGAHLVQSSDSGLWVFTTEVQAKYQDSAMALLENLLQDYADTGPTPQQFEDAKEQLRGSYLLGAVSNGQFSGMLAEIGFHQLPLDSRQTFLEQIQALTLDQLKVALKKHLKLDKLVQISVGPSVEQHDLPAPASG